MQEKRNLIFQKSCNPLKVITLVIEKVIFFQPISVTGKHLKSINKM
jgi:hypothetical protein